MCAGLRSALRGLCSATFRTSLAYSPSNSQPTFRSSTVTFRYVPASFSYSPMCAGLRSAPWGLRSATFRTSLAYSPSNSQPTFRSSTITFRYVPASFGYSPMCAGLRSALPVWQIILLYPKEGKDGFAGGSRDFREISVVGAASCQTDEVNTEEGEVTRNRCREG